MTEQFEQTDEGLLPNPKKWEDRPKMVYQSPRLEKLGDLRTITLAPTLGEELESGYGDSNYAG